jgi:hypothetical protein
MVSPTLHKALRASVGDEHVLARPIDLAAFASDASVYRLVPRAVLRRPSTTSGASSSSVAASACR